MNCRDCQDVGDSFLSDELLTETNHEILRHLDTCPSCREEIGVRRQLRDSVRAAFDRTPDLQPPVDFAEHMRDQLRAAATEEKTKRMFSSRWLMLAAGVVLAVGLGAAVFPARWMPPVDAIARDARGDHWNCALKHREVRTPVPLEEASERFDRAYRVLLDAPPDEVSTPNGPARVVDRHSCAFGTRRFGHVVLEYRQHVVSLLVTADDRRAAEGVPQPDLQPHIHGAPVDGLSVASIRGARHTILLVSDLDGHELSELTTTMSVPIVDQLVSGLTPADSHALATVFSNPPAGRFIQNP